MKKILSVGGVSCWVLFGVLAGLGLGVAQAQTVADIDGRGPFDGCFQLFNPGSMGPAFCLDGTIEEGVGGSGVRLVMFRTNTDRVAGCFRSSASGYTHWEGSEPRGFFYEMDGRRVLTLTLTEVGSSSRFGGKARIGNLEFEFVKLQSQHRDPLMRAYSDAYPHGCP